MQPDVGGHETILLVEDEPAILKMTTTMLQRLGYTVLSAGTPREGLVLAGKVANEIHLLLTDIIMPEMNGRDLANNLLASIRISNASSCLDIRRILSLNKAYSKRMFSLSRNHSQKVTWHPKLEWY